MQSLEGVLKPTEVFKIDCTKITRRHGKETGNPSRQNTNNAEQQETTKHQHNNTAATYTICQKGLFNSTA